MFKNGVRGVRGVHWKIEKAKGKTPAENAGDCDHRDDICKEWARYNCSFAEFDCSFVHVHVSIRHAQEEVPSQSGKYYDYLS